MNIRTILIVDDHPIVRQGIAQVIQHEQLADRILQASSVTCALAQLAEHDPGLVIVDLALGNDDGLQLVQAIRASRKDIRILVLSMHDERDHAELCIRRGADGYVMKQVATEQLSEAIQRLMRGEIALSTTMQRALIQGHRSSSPNANPAVASLSEKEREILALLGAGMSSAQIAERLHRSIKTIEAHRAALRGKLGLKTAVELIRFAALWNKRV